MMMMESIIEWCLLFSTEAREQLVAAQARLAASAAADTELGKSLARDLEHSLDGMVDYHTCEHSQLQQLFAQRSCRPCKSWRQASWPPFDQQLRDR